MLETDLLQSSVKNYIWALLCLTYLFWSGDRELLWKGSNRVQFMHAPDGGTATNYENVIHFAIKSL